MNSSGPRLKTALSRSICRWRYAARRSARSQNRKCTLFTFNESSDIRGAFVLKYESGSCPSRSCSYCFIEWEGCEDTTRVGFGGNSRFWFNSQVCKIRKHHLYILFLRRMKDLTKHKLSHFCRWCISKDLVVFEPKYILAEDEESLKDFRPNHRTSSSLRSGSVWGGFWVKWWSWTFSGLDFLITNDMGTFSVIYNQ